MLTPRFTPLPPTLQMLAISGGLCEKSNVHPEDATLKLLAVSGGLWSTGKSPGNSEVFGGGIGWFATVWATLGDLGVYRDRQRTPTGFGPFSCGNLGNPAEIARGSQLLRGKGPRHEGRLMAGRSEKGSGRSKKGGLTPEEVSHA